MASDEDRAVAVQIQVDAENLILSEISNRCRTD